MTTSTPDTYSFSWSLNWNWNMGEGSFDTDFTDSRDPPNFLWCCIMPCLFNIVSFLITIKIKGVFFCYQVPVLLDECMGDDGCHDCCTDLHLHRHHCCSSDRFHHCLSCVCHPCISYDPPFSPFLNSKPHNKLRKG